jgi:ParB/RepB/Spo0J family partition protein
MTEELKPKTSPEKIAKGPTGTAITKLLDSRLNPPTAKDKKNFPVPGEGDTFSVILHPGYLKKAEINRFSVDREADDFKELYKSIERFGVRDPVLARIGADRELEIISGQRRHLIAKELNYPVPTIIQQIDDDDAGILVADGNLHREHISTYDLSRALKLKAESMKRKAGRHSKGNGSAKPYTDEALASEMGMSVPKLNRLIKLSEATKQICDLVDDGNLALSIAYNIAFLPEEAQNSVADLIGLNVKVSTENTTVLKILAKTEALDYDKIRDVLEGKYPPKVEEKPKPVEQATPSMTTTVIPKSPDVPMPEPAPTAEKTPETHTADAPVAIPESPVAEAQDRENGYETKVVLKGDRLRKYFPDVSMTPREIEDSIYAILEEHRQRQEKMKLKAEHKFTR